MTTVNSLASTAITRLLSCYWEIGIIEHLNILSFGDREFEDFASILEIRSLEDWGTEI